MTDSFAGLDARLVVQYPSVLEATTLTGPRWQRRRGTTMLTEGVLFTFIAGLFAIMNPVGNVAVFASLTEGSSKEDVRYSAWTCAIACIVTLLIVTWFGDYVLDFFGISVDALRAAGGIIVLLIGLSMLANNVSKSDIKQNQGAECLYMMVMIATADLASDGIVR